MDEEQLARTNIEKAAPPKDTNPGATASPSNPDAMKIELDQPDLIKNLFGVMCGEEDEVADTTDHSPFKNKAKTKVGR